MGGLLGEAYPHAVLLGALHAEQGKEGHQEKHDEDAKLYIGIGTQALEHERVVVAHLVVAARLVHIHADDVACTAHGCRLVHEIAQRVGAMDAHVAVALDAASIVEHDDGDGVVATDDGEYKREVGAFIGVVEGAHGLGPYLHAGGLLTLEVAHQEVGEDERCHAQQHGYHDERYLDSACTIDPFHSIYSAVGRADHFLY